jgi:exopolyphosphatase/guanosine-5'-triphosphate,3'-diphosphate pyrophosphatase
MLGWAARLHEIGLAIAHSQFHRHGAYIAANADLPGFSRQQQNLLAALIRGHRRKFPAEAFDALPEPLRRSARQLCVLLRLAVLIHRGRTARGKPRLRIEAAGSEVRLRFPPDWLDAHPLTRSELEQEALLLRAGGFGLAFE